MIHKFPNGLLRNQQGLILLIALIVLVTMTLAGIALVRSVDTSNVIAGNLSFKRGTLHASELAIGTVQAAFKTGLLSGATATESNNPAANYSTVQLTVSNGRGIPDVLMDRTSFDGNPQFKAAKITNPATKEELRYVIERLCTRTGPPDTQACINMDQDPNAGSDNKTKLDLAPPVLFRITVRVDGPRNTLSFIQTTFLP